ncbi:MAG: C39 family peptidase [Candidatus Saganbacteria bacterium]|nr:C39 family peptidase [Candidatus Saganbacteria bacterium]
MSCCFLLSMFLVSDCFGDTPSTTMPTGTFPLVLNGVPDVRQAEHYSCGAASFQAVMNYYGKDSFESDLRTMLGTSASHGTYPWDMVRVAKQLGFDAEWKDNLTLSDLEAALRQGIPVIVDAQRYTAPNTAWKDSWIPEAGHFMVVIGIDDRNVYLEDPFLLGSRLVMPRQDFSDCWHGYESSMPLPPNAKKYHHVGVIIRGTPPAAARPEFIGPRVMPDMIQPTPIKKMKLFY